MRRIHHLLALLLLSGISTSALAQSNFQPGYVISQSGDTLRGNIDFRQWTRNPTSIDFRSATGDTKNYGVADIRGFMVAEERYESAVVQVDGSPFEIGELPHSSALQMRRDEAFVRVLFSGPKSLYYYQDRNNKEHFFIRHNGGLDLLIYKQFIPEAESRVVTDRGFVGQLETYLGDCPSIKPRLRTARYTVAGLEKIFTQYYACTGKAAPAASRESIDVAKVHFGVLAGVGITRLSYQRSQLRGTLPRDMDFAASAKPAGGLYVDFGLPRRLNRFSITTELFYTAFQAKYGDQNFVNPDSYSSRELQLDLQYIQFNALTRYRYPLGASGSIFAHAGGTIGLAYDYKQTFTETTYFYGQETRSQVPGLTIDSMELCFLTGVGTSYKRLSAEARLSLGNGITSAFYEATTSKRYFFLLGYRF